MFPRVLKLPKEQSFFLFGARNTGKSTLLKQIFLEDFTLIFDLLDKTLETRFRNHPDLLYDIVMEAPKNITHIFIDEIQKIPELLDVVHRLMNETKKIFILSGSSARQLKKGGANLLAGRAFVFHLFPLTFLEMGEKFSLDHVLQWGSLPSCVSYEDDEMRNEFLYAYAHTYLKEEIWMEQFVKKLDPFHRFLEVAAQSNGKVINFSNIARDVGVSDKTIQTYYSILEDTLLGFFLEAYHGSFRKRLSKQPKFYLFDTGVTRALAFLTDVKLVQKTNAYGNAFEHFIILECIRLADYYRLHYRFYYLRTSDDKEIDLVVERPGKPLLCIEIKSSDNIDEHHLKTFINLSKDMTNTECICICKEKFKRKIMQVTLYPWKQALQEYFTKR